MGYPLHIEPSEETLRMLDEKFTPVAEDRFIYCLQQKKWTIEEVHTFNARLQISFDYTMKEYQRMEALRETYNKEYPTNHKKYFSTAVELMSKMRSTLSAYKKITSEFQQKKKRGSKLKEGVTAYDRTPLYNGEYSQDLFAWETYPDKSVKEMHKNLNDYLELAGKCLDLCLEVIEEEQSIRANPEWAYALYKVSFDRSVGNCKRMIEYMKQQEGNIDHDIVNAMEKAENVKQLIAELYHMFNHSDFNFYCACKTISDGRKAGLSPEESALFGKDNTEKVARIRTLLDHILELASKRDDAIGWEGMLDGGFVMHLLFWCGWNGSKNEALLNYVTKRCEGKIRVVKMGAVMRAKRQEFRLDNKDRIARQIEFDTQMDAFVDSILSQTTEKHD
jgi:hypothetical protein